MIESCFAWSRLFCVNARHAHAYASKINSARVREVVGIWELNGAREISVRRRDWHGHELAVEVLPQLPSERSSLAVLPISVIATRENIHFCNHFSNVKIISSDKFTFSITGRQMQRSAHSCTLNGFGCSWRFWPQKRRDKTKVKCDLTVNYIRRIVIQHSLLASIFLFVCLYSSSLFAPFPAFRSHSWLTTAPPSVKIIVAILNYTMKT